jgi:MurNAc alpha-1-phosphate uridylyltransferase
LETKNMNDTSRHSIPHTAFVLSAGLGMRMRPLTLDKPKPLLKVGGKTMLDQVLDQLVAFGIQRCVINIHYKSEMIAQHVAGRISPSIIISHEETLLDTGGGIKNALVHLGDDPIFALNADLPWRDGAVSALKRLAQAFDPEKMDALLLLYPTQKARGFHDAPGDFFMSDSLGKPTRLIRKDTSAPRPYVFISAQIIKPALFKDVSENIFSTNIIWNKLEEQGRLYGLVHDGSCYHVGTPADLSDANHLLESGQGW